LFAGYILTMVLIFAVQLYLNFGIVFSNYYYNQKHDLVIKLLG